MHSVRKSAGLGLLVAAVACGSGTKSPPPTPSSPSPPPPSPPQPTTHTISGTVTATNGGEPIAASLDFGVTTSASDGSGHYSVSVPVTASTLSLAISGAGLVSRRTYVSPGTRTVDLDAIRDGDGFDLTFYRRLVRNGFEAPTALEPLRRWTRSPQIHLQTTTLVDSKTVDLVEQLAREMIPRWTDNRLSVATVERGPNSRFGQSGWLSIGWSVALFACGEATLGVGAESAEITLFPRTSGCACNGYGIAPRTIKHELGHALGFWHTDRTSDLMFRTQIACDQNPSGRELYHAAIAYRRPIGNQDPDVDPQGAVNLAPMTVR